uniref:Uncharacterized protein n=1 Tax=Haptolina brevifila TaxID=156173 RepID=A0A7S2MDI0_9EUKA|mmetsp:Transcript_49905/g.99329  ORF Transcript_49905/g.99329 Transcript_49905/m.99329 type:complete len:268 (+) Transcript_49905:101-904(+)
MPPLAMLSLAVHALQPSRLAPHVRARWGAGAADGPRYSLRCICTMMMDDAYSNFAPSEKQLQYAQRLAQRTGLDLPPEALSDKESCSAFIDEALSKSPPSANQVAYAKSLAQSACIELPEQVLRSAKSCSEFIDEIQQSGSTAGFAGGSAGGGAATSRLPTDKQIIFAASLARQQQIGLSHEVLSDRAAASSFIDSMLAGGGAPNANTPIADPSGLSLVSESAVAGQELQSTQEPLEPAPFDLPAAVADAGDGNQERSLFREGQIPF